MKPTFEITRDNLELVLYPTDNIAYVLQIKYKKIIHIYIKISFKNMLFIYKVNF